MTLDIEGMYIIALKECNCKDEKPQIGSDGYSLGISQRRCMECFGTGTVRTKINLTDLKALLGGS